MASIHRPVSSERLGKPFNHAARFVELANQRLAWLTTVLHTERSFESTRVAVYRVYTGYPQIYSAHTSHSSACVCCFLLTLQELII
jgi:hypothetical protein